MHFEGSFDIYAGKQSRQLWRLQAYFQIELTLISVRTISYSARD